MEFTLQANTSENVLQVQYVNGIQEKARSDHFACVRIGDFDSTGYEAHPLVIVNATCLYCYPRPFGRRAIPWSLGNFHNNPILLIH